MKKKAQNQTKEREVRNMKEMLKSNKRNNISSISSNYCSLDNTSSNKYQCSAR